MEVRVNILKRVTIGVVVICGFFMIALPLRVYAQSSGNLNNNPIIVMDKKVIAIDRQNLNLRKHQEQQRR
jgi:hypothetical protein